HEGKKLLTRLRNKERERMREREKAAREREARYSNGHLFTSLTVSATTLCSACNKSITAKEALSCPTCNVTIHNRCRDTLPNCAKMKQRQQKMALIRNNSAVQNVTLRTKTPGMRERPSSAIYPSDSFRQSLLGSRRGRSNLSLSKSVSTNNIAGTLTDNSPLGLRRILSQSTDSLSFRTRAMSVESLNDDGITTFNLYIIDLELESQDFKADSWSMAVESSYLQTHRKNVIKRQDVIYELIQTELHHMRTLHIMERVFRQGMLEELQLDLCTVYAMFPCLDQLTRIHSHFLAQLLLRRNSSLQSGSSRNFTIHQLGDMLLEQFSGQCADEMRKTYAEFCSRHLKAVKLYKELMARDKKFQCFIRRLSRGPLLRCHGVQECILLVTQRISKYPVLVQRILDNTSDDDEEEASSLAQALSMVRELLSSIDQQMEDLEKAQRLQEIQAKLDPRAEAKVRYGGLFKPGELFRRRLVHDGTLFWKTPGSRLKDTQVLLMTDILVFLQEKDQRYIFPCVDKSPVLSLQNLIVRDIANQERGMFLISDSSPPEMYEFHAASKEDKNVWIRHIQRTVSKCPSREEFPLIETEHKAHLRRLKADLQQKDREMLELLQERVTLFCELAEVTSGQEALQPPITRYLFRADTPQAPRAEKLLLDATREGTPTVCIQGESVSYNLTFKVLEANTLWIVGIASNHPLNREDVTLQAALVLGSGCRVPGSMMEEQRMDSMMEEQRMDSMMEEQRMDSMMEEQRMDSMMDEQRMDSMMEEQRMDSMMEEQMIDSMMEEQMIDSMMEEQRMDSMKEEQRMDSMMEEQRMDSMMEEQRMDSMMEEQRMDSMMEEQKMDSMMEEQRIYPMMEEQRIYSMMEEQRMDSMMRRREWTQ
uniref:Rho/Rac guanine nucleotide exchange factor 2 n=1 Tax=Cyclopterus lumpus TaxID=8103 RepID=A0A8C2WR11_CYCLU